MEKDRMDLTLDPGLLRAARAALSFRTQAFIDGKYSPSASGKTYTSVNPANGKPLAEIADCGPEDVEAAVRAARRAFRSGVWSKLKSGDRKHVMLKFVELVEKNALELALLDCLDAGKPICDCVNIDIPDTIHCIRWHAELIDKLYERTSPSGPEVVSLIVREPIGVVACILPWNFPIQMMAWKIGPALAAGNSVVLKPARQTALSALRTAEIAAEAGIPDGVFNVVPGAGSVLGPALCRHMDVDMAAFTGSTSVGRDLLRYSAESNLKRIILELGGKNPQVVLADANLDNAAPHVVSAAFWNMGENCSAGSRLIIRREIKDALLEKVVAQTRLWPVGDPLDPATRVGPLIEPAHMKTVLGYIDAGKREGARLVLGGNRVLAETGGNFVEPTIFDEATNAMTVAREEIFGPVLAVIPVDSDEEAIAVANDTNYGLAASLHTTDIAKAHRFAREIRAGVVAVNCFGEGDLTTPFGGFKESGFFGRDKSSYAQEQYTELKTVWIQL
jgi:gamma-glutamyl-gamma-aminobutyraldehyde dehydrogenase